MKIRLIISAYLFLNLLTGFSFEEGLASWYGGKFNGRKTASGEIFDTNKFTAAHRSLPFGTLVRVTNLMNGKVTVVRITDRGPFVAGRVIDLSRIAAFELDMFKYGIVPVKIEVVGKYPPDSFYRLQIGAFNKRENALLVKEKLQREGFCVYFEEINNSTIRVWVDNIPQALLEGKKKLLAELGFEKIILKKINIK